MSCPVVSVIVPSYNHAQFLEQRLESILNQTFQDFELIILDDLSPDASRDIIEKYRQHPKVSQIIYNEKNSGSTFAQWNNAIFNYAKGKYVWIAESDDVADLNFLKQLVNILNEEVVLAYSQSSKINASGEVTGSWIEWTNTLPNCEKFNTDFSMGGKEYIEKYLIHQNTIPNASAVLFRKDVYIEVGGAEKSQKTTGDWHLWMKMILKGNIYFTSKELNKFRYHNTSVIARAKNNSKSKLVTKYKLLEDVLNMRMQLKKEKTFSRNKNILEINNRVLRNIKIKRALLFLPAICFK